MHQPVRTWIALRVSSTSSLVQSTATKYSDGGLRGSVVVQTWCSFGPMPCAECLGRFSRVKAGEGKGKRGLSCQAPSPPSPFLRLPPTRPPSFLPSFTNQLILTIVFLFGKSFLPTSYTSTPSCSVLFFSLFFFLFLFFSVLVSFSHATIFFFSFSPFSDFHC